MFRVFAFAVALMCLFLISAAPAAGNHIACGDRVSASTTLDSDIINCPGTALEVDGVGITLDLGGHVVDGTGNGQGINATLARNANSVVIRNGTVRDFFFGVVLGAGAQGQLLERVVVTDNFRGVDAQDAGGVTVRHVTAFGNAVGLSIGSFAATVVDNEAYANEAGMAAGRLEQSVVSGNRFHDNLFSGLGFSFARGNRFTGNRIDGNGTSGIVIGEEVSDNVIADNRVSRSGGDGIMVPADGDADANLIDRNHVDRNADDGIDIDALGFTVSANKVINNGDLGIEAVAGTIDGGGNKASANGNPAQCVGVSCK